MSHSVSIEDRYKTWLDERRKANPSFMPDTESAKELLTEEELAEIVEYEELRYRSVAGDPNNRYKSYRMTKAERKRLIMLAIKYSHIYFVSPETIIPRLKEMLEEL